MKGMNPTTLRAQELKDQCAHDLDGAEKEDFGDRWGWIEVLISCLPSYSRQGQQSLEAREGEAQLPKGAFLIPSQVCGTKCNNKMTPKQQDYQDQSNDKARPY